MSMTAARRGKLKAAKELFLMLRFPVLAKEHFLFDRVPHRHEFRNGDSVYSFHFGIGRFVQLCIK